MDNSDIINNVDNSKIIKSENTIKKKKMDELFMKKKELILMMLSDTEINKIIDTQYKIINDEYKENVNKNNSKIIDSAHTIKKKKMDELFMKKKELILMMLCDAEIKKIIDTQYEIINDEYKKNVKKKRNDMNNSKIIKSACTIKKKDELFIKKN